ncbi:hypothetical protein ACFE04_009660 [Oxalis oulophora]
MAAEVQRVVLIQDASRDVSPEAIGNVLKGFSLKPGDAFFLLGILHQVNNPMGYKVKIDSNSMFGASHKIIKEEFAKKQEEYKNNEDIIKFSNQCKEDNIEFQVGVKIGSSSKMVALKAAKNFKATWIILDRQMKNDKNFFKERLWCGISRTKRDNSIEVLREPRSKRNARTGPERSSTDCVTYDEMIPEYESPRLTNLKLRTIDDESPWKDNRKLTALSKSSSSEQLGASTSKSNTELKYHSTEDITTATEKETTGDSPLSITETDQKESAYETGSPEGQTKQHINQKDWMAKSPSEEFKNSICSICQNKRPKIGWKRDFTYAEIYAATEAFNPKNFLSEGGFGSVYRGELNGLKIAVKQHKNASFQGEKEFKAEVQVLSTARHENLVMLLGSCSEKTHRLLVYEYVCAGSLDQHLSKHARRPLSWDKRVKVALGAAKGLLYLHENNIVHRDMRPSNILVTHDYEILLGDFGLARTQQEDSDHSTETRVVGTLGYLAPEYAECGKVSTKTDVYAFGVVLLQLITGLKTTDKILGGKSLVGWARPLLKERDYPSLIDQRLIDSYDVHQLFWMVRVAEKCLSKDPQKRLTMKTVVYALNYIMDKEKNLSFKDFSPARSDSGSPEFTDDIESQADDESYITIEPTPINNWSQMSLGRLPPSPPMQTFQFFKNFNDLNSSFVAQAAQQGVHFILRWSFSCDVSELLGFASTPQHSVFLKDYQD